MDHRSFKPTPPSQACACHFSGSVRMSKTLLLCSLSSTTSVKSQYLRWSRDVAGRAAQKGTEVQSNLLALGRNWSSLRVCCNSSAAGSLGLTPESGYSQWFSADCLASGTRENCSIRICRISSQTTSDREKLYAEQTARGGPIGASLGLST